MTLHHRINTYHGQQTHNGTQFHAYRTVCGASIVAVPLFKQGQLIATGPAPHAQCAKCFRAHQNQQGNRVIEGDHPVSSPDQGLGSLGKQAGGAMAIDDKGGSMSAPIEKSDVVGNYVPDPYANKTIAVTKTVREGDRILKTEIRDPMGDIESQDYQ